MVREIINNVSQSGRNGGGEWISTYSVLDKHVNALNYMV